MSENKNKIDNDIYFSDENYQEVNDIVEEIIENEGEYITYEYCEDYNNEDYDNIEAEVETETETEYSKEDEELGRKIIYGSLWILSIIYIIIVGIKLLLNNWVALISKEYLIIFGMSLIFLILSLILIRFSYSIAYHNIKHQVDNKDNEPSTKYVFKYIIIGLSFYVTSLLILIKL
jgi:hypothetical protein